MAFIEETNTDPYTLTREQLIRVHALGAALSRANYRPGGTEDADELVSEADRIAAWITGGPSADEAGEG